MSKIGRNDPCPCGSGRKYKHCCLADRRGTSTRTRVLMLLVGLVLVAGAILAVTWEPGADSRRVWSEEHGHWHTVP